jgi:peroxiredoxin|tara:strand:- start:236 stop:385 length:150 start_codon:yes stop_codon:yes gene_type:complete
MPEKQRTKTLAVGEAAPEFVLPDTDGGSFRLSEYRGERAVALVFLRHTW